MQISKPASWLNLYTSGMSALPRRRVVGLRLCNLEKCKIAQYRAGAFTQSPLIVPLIGEQKRYRIREAL